MKQPLIYTSTIALATSTQPYTIRRSRKARHILLHVDTVTGIELVVPWRVSVREAEAFLNTKRRWIERVLQRHQTTRTAPPVRRFITNEQFPLFEDMFTLEVDTQSTALPKLTQENMTLRVRARSVQDVRTKLEQWYRKQARTYFTDASYRISKEIDVYPKKISIRNQKTQWGSCSARNTLSFNWRLLLGPERVAQYVAVHEVVHLKHRNHSAHFWQQVQKLQPTYKEDRAWLRKNGPLLAW